jgi:RNA polymerase sigma-70 factor (ECF subfamily)
MAFADEQGLIERSRLGDRQAFARIVHQTARLVYARVALDVPDKHRAEDITQEVFLAAWRSIGQLEDAGALRAWLLAIAASKVADDVRRSGAFKRSANVIEATENVPAPSGDPAAEVQSRDQRDRALAALRGLPEEYREPLTLRYLAGADYDTIGRQLALSNGALRGLLHRGLALLRKRLSE